MVAVVTCLCKSVLTRIYFIIQNIKYLFCKTHELLINVNSYIYHEKVTKVQNYVIGNK